MKSITKREVIPKFTINSFEGGDSLIDIQEKYEKFIASQNHHAINNYSNYGIIVLFLLVSVLILIICIDHSKLSCFKGRSTSSLTQVDSTELLTMRSNNYEVATAPVLSDIDENDNSQNEIETNL